MQINKSIKIILPLIALTILVAFFLKFFYQKNQSEQIFEAPRKKKPVIEGEQFKNRYLEEAITEYLLSEKNFSWKTKEGSHNLCVVENLDPEKELFPLFLWSYCAEYIMENQELKTISGSSLPIKINYPNELSYYDINKFSHETPRDGADYAEDVKTIFPEDVQEKIFQHDIRPLIDKAETYALTNITDWNSIKQALADCQVKLIMQTHSLHVTATLKNGTTIKAKEPAIDDIFELVKAHEKKCGKIELATE